MNQAKIKYFYKNRDERIYEYMADLDFSAWITPHVDYFASLCRAIIGQQLSGKAADSIEMKFLSLMDKTTPHAVLALSDEELRRAGLSRAKTTYIKNIAQAFCNNSINESSIPIWTDAVVIDHLTAIKGIGKWTAEMFLIFTLGREDVFSYGDLGLKKGFQKVYGLEPINKNIDPIIERWSPYKTYGSFALWHSLEK